MMPVTHIVCGGIGFMHGFMEAAVEKILLKPRSRDSFCIVTGIFCGAIVTAMVMLII